MFGVSPGLVGYNREQRRSYMNELTELLETLPGIRSVTLSTFRPGSSYAQMFVDAPGFESATTMERVTRYNLVGPRFVETVGLHLRRGRDFQISDKESWPRIAIVNESFARYFFGTEDAIGRQFGLSFQRDRPYEVIGIVADARDAGPKSPFERVAYCLDAHENSSSAEITVRHEGPETAVIPSILAVSKNLDATVPVRDIRTIESQVSEALGREQLLATLGAAFGGFALLLVTIGLYGLLAGVVVRRTNEIGIRMALGARRGSILRLILRDGLGMVFLGLACGVGGGLLLTRFVRSQLFGVAPSDPATFIVTAAALLTVSLAAVLPPAHRATRIDPTEALRHE
jgi:predicted permease